MLDWEGHLTTTVFVAGCNLRCPYCHNPDLLVAGDRLDTEPLIEHLHAKRDWLDGAVITGGEPTLDPGLFDLLDEIAALCLPVKLDTNGTKPDVLRGLIESGLVSAVALDIKTSPHRYGELGPGSRWEPVSESLRLVLGSGIPHEVRTTAYPGLVAIDDLAAIARSAAGADRYRIQQFRPDRTLARTAGRISPYSAEALHDAAVACSEYVPTSVRGA
jgi:pyruvate formate lyase activating enzyme